MPRFLSTLLILGSLACPSSLVAETPDKATDPKPAETVRDFGVYPEQLEGIIDTGEPFRMSGCVGRDGEVACNRPFGNSPPGPDIRNYPFLPTPEDVARIRSQMIRCWERRNTTVPSPLWGEGQDEGTPSP